MKTPIIQQLRQKIVAGERRRSFLQRKVDDGAGTETSLGYDRAEIAFIDAAIRALEFVEIFRHPRMSPVVALSSLVDALDEAGLPAPTNEHDALSVAVVAARRTLLALEAD